MLKLRKDITDEILIEEYGFKLESDDEDYTIHEMLCYEIGHSRRGQFYYYIVNEDRTLSVYASDPDGSGGSIKLDGTLLDMFLNGILEQIQEA